MNRHQRRRAEAQRRTQERRLQKAAQLTYGEAIPDPALGGLAMLAHSVEFRFADSIPGFSGNCMFRAFAGFEVAHQSDIEGASRSARCFIASARTRGAMSSPIANRAMPAAWACAACFTHGLAWATTSSIYRRAIGRTSIGWATTAPVRRSRMNSARCVGPSERRRYCSVSRWCVGQKPSKSSDRPTIVHK